MPQQRKNVQRKKGGPPSPKRNARRSGQAASSTQRVAAAVNVGAAFKMPSKRLSALPNGSIAVHNKEIILTVSGAATAGTIPAITGVSAPIALASTALTWLSKFSTIYDKYVFKSLKLTWVPTLPTTTSGSVAIHFDSDDNGGATFISSATNDSALVCPIFEQSSTTVPRHLLSSLPWFSANDTLGPAVQGEVAVASTAIVLLNAAATGTITIGFVMVEYIVHLKNASSS